MPWFARLPLSNWIAAIAASFAFYLAIAPGVAAARRDRRCRAVGAGRGSVGDERSS
jgi:ABC-type dipeptide/oligopeptide/nickel transport system permease component